MTNNGCVFCNVTDLAWRTIRQTEFSQSIVSTPRFRAGHCLVVPRRHIDQPGQLTIPEAGEILLELDRLAALLDRGYGTGMMQKYQPTQPENGIKVHHLHWHVFPRRRNEQDLFPVPSPNAFTGFRRAPKAQISRLVARLR